MQILAEAQPVNNPTCVQTAAIPVDFASMIAAAIEAALQPMTERMEATIVPHIGNSPSGIFGSAIRRESRFKQSWRCNGSEKVAVGGRCVDFAGTVARDKCEHMSAIKLLEDFFGAISGDSLAPPAREMCESMAVFGITGEGEVFCQISALIDNISLVKLKLH